MTSAGSSLRSGEAKQAGSWPVLLAAALALVLAAPVATWWLVGPLRAAPGRGGLRHAFTPLPVSPVAARAAGITAMIVAAVSVAFLIWATARRRLDLRWWRVLVPLLAAGFVAGAGWRVLTAGTRGTDAAAGVTGFLWLPVLVILVAWALGYALFLGWGQAPPAPAGPPPDLLTWAQAVDVSAVTDHTVKAAQDYLRDHARLTALAGREYGLRLMSLLETQVLPPPPLSLNPTDIAATVLAVRRKQLGTEDWPGWTTWPGKSDWSAWADWPGWNRNR